MMLRKLLGLMMLGVLPLAGMASQSLSGSNDISINFSDTSVSIRISKSMKLADVLGAVCSTAHLRCDVQESAVQEEIAPQTIRGSWQEVMAQLLDGARVNYVVVPPANSSAGSLLVQQGSAGASVEVPAAAVLSEGNDTIQEPAAELAQSEQSAVAPPPAAEESASSSDSSAEPTMAAPESTLSSGMAYSPFPDAHGNPVAVEATNEPMQYGIFPDANGNPVPVQPTNEPMAYGIFPDANGNPIPLAPPNGEPLEYSIFPDPHGNPVPLPH